VTILNERLVEYVKRPDRRFGPRQGRASRDRSRWIRHDNPGGIDVAARVRSGVWKGVLAGAGGVAVMTIGEKIEQHLTRRPSSYVPAHTLERVAGVRQRPDRERHAMNLAMHIGQAVLLGAWRGLMAEGGLRGPERRRCSPSSASPTTRRSRTSPGRVHRPRRGRATSCSSTSCTKPSTGSRPGSSPMRSQKTRRLGRRHVPDGQHTSGERHVKVPRRGEPHIA
jgi:hypothetical protein